MGGYGSGRTGWHGKAEHHRSLDVTRMHQTGVLKPGYRGGWHWTLDGEKVASIGLRTEANLLTLHYTIGGRTSEARQVEEQVRLTPTDCHFGGKRIWFICPGVVNGRACQRRVGKLYLGQSYFVCRHCMRLVYACQSEAAHERHLRGAHKGRRRLGSEAGWGFPYPRKPKGMHWRTYWARIAQIETYEAHADRAFLGWISGRFPGLPSDDILL